MLNPWHDEHSGIINVPGEIPRNLKVPSGYVNIAIENGHRNSGFSHEKW